jgi:hypothetical protein
MEISINDQLLNLIEKKGVLSKNVTDLTFEVFTSFKRILLQIEKNIKEKITDERIKIQYHDSGTFEGELKIGDDVLIFLMYTNAVVLDSHHPIWKNSYVSKVPERGTCGMISIYNFLTDSFKYERRNDTGVLIARIFINSENHFFMEGKKQLSILYNDFNNDIIKDEAILNIIEKSIQYSIDVDIIAPSFDMMKEISVSEVIDYSLQASIASGKRLGFKFENKEDSEL